MVSLELPQHSTWNTGTEMSRLPVSRGQVLRDEADLERWLLNAPRVKAAYSRMYWPLVQVVAMTGHGRSTAAYPRASRCPASIIGEWFRHGALMLFTRVSALSSPASFAKAGQNLHQSVLRS